MQTEARPARERQFSVTFTDEQAAAIDSIVKRRGAARTMVVRDLVALGLLAQAKVDRTIEEIMGQ